ncbi:MAG TPA: P-loop NTPase fold protein [Gemmatimonadales bacterium]
MVPVSASGTGGLLAQAFLAAISSPFPKYAHRLAELLGKRPRMTPEDPVALSPSKDEPVPGLPPHLILATAEAKDPLTEDSSGHSAVAAGVAARMVVLQAERSGWARLILPLLGSGSAGLPAVDVAIAVMNGVLAALPAEHVREVTLVTLDANAVQALSERSSARAQSLANDLPSGSDLLDVEGEVAALAEAILLREMEPPLVVGVLGGWGSGKSFVMHLMRERISQIRTLRIDDPSTTWQADKGRLFPYVGHPYVISFDAWTYANADLWASLMQTIFHELSRQITLEYQLERSGVNSLAGGDVWRALSLLNEPERLAVVAAALADKDAALLRAAPHDAVTKDILWKRMQDLKRDQLQKLERTRQRRSTLQQQLEQAKGRIAQEVAEELDEEARREAWAPVVDGVMGALQGAVQRMSPESAAAFKDAPADLNTLAADVHFFEKLKQAPPAEVALFLAVALAAVATPFATQLLEQLRVPGLVAGAVTMLLAWRRVALHWQEWWSGVQRDYETRRQEVRARLVVQRDTRVERRLAEQRAELEQALSTTLVTADFSADAVTSLLQHENVAALEREIHRLEAEEAAYAEKIGTPAGFVSLAEFVRARLEGAQYESKLGLMHQVQRDIASLSDCLVVHEEDLHRAEKIALFPRGPARVVLFIDDLDRCPPDQVVAVLEAVQLLVKTRLFVVVLGMDVRYVTRALEKRYEGILWRRGEPSGLDYIEKIVQVPYRVRPIEQDAFAGFVASQMRVGASGAAGAGRRVSGDVGSVASLPPVQPSPPAVVPVTRPLPRTVLDFSLEERWIVSDCCAAIELSPRSVKRVVNVCKLLRIIWHRSERHAEPTPIVKHAIVLLLALAARFPGAMRDLLDELSEASRDGQRTVLGTWLKQRVRQHAAVPIAGTHWTELRTALERQAGILNRVSLRNLRTSECNLVRSFSFLGDIGTAPDEFPRNGGSVRQLAVGPAPGRSVPPTSHRRAH